MIVSLCKKKSKYYVTLVFETVIYQSKLLNFKNFESLVFALFLSKTQNIGFSADAK